MNVTIRLYQEGRIDFNGFLLTQWIDNAVTTYARAVPIFVLRKILDGQPDVLERVATVTDISQLVANPITFFEPKFAGANPFSGVVPGDKLRINVSTMPHWVTTTAIDSQAYVDTGDGFMDFTVAAIEAVPGLPYGPPSVTGTSAILPGYTFSSSDVGRTLSISGMANSANNGPTEIIGGAGQTFLTTKTFVTETGAAPALWQFYRFRVDAVKPLMRVEPAGWQVRQNGTNTLLFSGVSGQPSRLDPALDVFLDDRVTTIYGDADTANNVAIFVRAFVQSLQRKLHDVGTSFTSVGPYDFGP